MGIIRSNEKQSIECNVGSLKVLDSVGNVSFGKLCTCIHKSESSCWKSSSGESFDSISRTNKTNLDAERPNNLSPKKPREVDSKPKQDAELPSNIASTQPHGPCHDKKSE